MELGPDAQYGKVIVDEYDDNHNTGYFILAWISANAIGIGIGWPLAEYVGGRLVGALGGATALAVAAAVYELLLWSLRAVVFARVRSASLARRIDAVIMIATEIFGWVLGESFYRAHHVADGSLLRFTMGSYWAVYFSGMLWAMLWLYRVQSRRRQVKLPRGRAWLGSMVRITASLLVFASFVIVPVLCSELGDGLARSVGSYIGMGAEGVAFGIYMGALSGMAMTGFLGETALPLREHRVRNPEGRL